MATKVRALVVVLVAFSHVCINEAFTLMSGTAAQAEALSYHRERQRHHASLANRTRHMTLEKALHVLKERHGAPKDLVKYLHHKLHQKSADHQRLRAGHHHTHSRGDEAEATYGGDAARAKDMLNDMIYEVQTQYEIEHKKCCDYEHTKRALIEDAAQDIALFNSESAAARAEILDAQGHIAIAEERVPALRDELAEHNRKCKADLEALTSELGIVSGDKEEMESLSDAAACSTAAPLALIQCTNPCTQEPHILFANKTMRQLMQKLRSKTAHQLLQHHLPKVHGHASHHHRAVNSFLQMQLEDEMVTAFNARAKANSTDTPLAVVGSGPCHKPAPTDMRSSKCSMGPGDCEVITERLLTIHSKIIDKVGELKEQIKKLEGTCETVKKSFDSQISDFNTQLLTEQAKLAEATKAQNTADEQNRLKTIEKSDMEKEFAEMTTTCHKNYQSFEDQECGLKKIRGELMRLKAPDASSTFGDCQLSEWSMGECSASCQGGTQTLTRTVVTAPKGGVKCLPLERVQSCNEQKCPIDCKVADWQSWSGCTAECGGGVMQRSRLLDVKPKYGGKPCGETSEVRSCNLQSCNAECGLGAWTAWSECSKACGGGRQRRLRFIETPARGTGTCPTEKDDARLQYMECNTKACSAGLECQSVLDVVLLLDGSSRMGEDGWDAVKQSSQLLVRALGAGGRVNVAVILFSGPTTLHALSACTNEDPSAAPADMEKDCHIKVVSRLSSNTAQVVDKIKELSWPKGSALTSVALGMAEAELALGRKDAASVVLVVTRGKPLSVDKTTLMAQRLKKKARVMWVPVAGFDPLDTFRLWSSDPDDENVIVMSDFLKLKEPKSIDTIVASMCPAMLSKAAVPTPTHDWTFRGCSGEVVKDAQSDLSAELYNAICMVDGVHFPGGVESVFFDPFSIGGSFTIEVSVKLASTLVTGDVMTVFNFGDGPGKNDMVLQDPPGGTEPIAWQVNRDGADPDVQMLRGGFVRRGTWQHVVVTSSPGSMKIFLNGALAAQKSGVQEAVLSTRTDYYTEFQGVLGALRVWQGSVLTEDVVTSMYKNEVSFCPKSSAGQAATDVGCPIVGRKDGSKLDKCEDHCRATAGCTGFDFHEGTGSCVLRACPDSNKPRS